MDIILCNGSPTAYMVLPGGGGHLVKNKRSNDKIPVAMNSHSRILIVVTAVNLCVVVDERQCVKTARSRLWRAKGKGIS